MKRYYLAPVLAVAMAQAPMAPSQSPASAHEEEYKSKVRPFLVRNCQGCHNAKNKTAGIAVDGLTTLATLDTAGDDWEKILRKVKTGEMPPSNLPRPPLDQTKHFTHFVEAHLDQLAAAHPDPGRVTLHRLNKSEYNNAMRDLFGIDFQPADDFPADDTGYGFDNVADVLSLPPLLMEKYLSAATKVTRQVIGVAKVNAALEKYTADRRRSQRERISDELPFGSRGGLVVNHRFPAEGEYLFRVRLTGAAEKNLPAPMIDWRIDGQRVKLIEGRISDAEEEEEKRRFEFRMPMKAGRHEVAVTFLAETWEPEGGAPRALNVDFIEIGGPFNPVVSKDTPARRRVFVCSTEDTACAQKILNNVARRAYRRPVTAAESASLMRFFAMGQKDGGSFDAGVQLALKTILVSPNFLFRREADQGGIHRVTDLELASRLSFFLWSSIPDEELLTLAEQKKLSQPAVLGAQVKRMLADAKSEALIRNFAGQWLQLRNIPQLKPDPDKFPEFDNELRQAMTRETELFFESVMREDRSLLDLLDGKYTFVNERLAKHYGMSGVKGSRFRRVELDGVQRSGVLTQASILTISSYPTRTSPVIRGKWILENLLGAPPPPPPPDVPGLDKIGINPNATLRQQMAEHRTNPACASCHIRMDTMGFMLENYDAIGRYRTHDGKLPIDASGEMNGIKADGAAGLKTVIREKKDEFVEAVVDRMMTYALGRGLERYDKPVIRALSRDLASHDYRFSRLITGIVESLPFQNRRGVELKKSAD